MTECGAAHLRWKDERPELPGIPEDRPVLVLTVARQSLRTSEKDWREAAIDLRTHVFDVAGERSTLSGPDQAELLRALMRTSIRLKPWETTELTANIGMPVRRRPGRLFDHAGIRTWLGPLPIAVRNPTQSRPERIHESIQAICEELHDRGPLGFRPYVWEGAKADDLVLLAGRSPFNRNAQFLVDSFLIKL